MTNYLKWRNKQKELLQKVLYICDRQEIDIFLCGETALEAYKNRLLTDDIVVAIDVTDVFRFINAVESLQDERIAVESMLNNGVYPNFDLRVYDKTTVDFDINNHIKYVNNCINIRIKIVEHLIIGGLPFAMGRLAFRKYRKRRSNLDKDNIAVSSKLFRMMVLLGKGQSNKIWIGNCKHSACTIQNMRPIKVEDLECHIPESISVFLVEEFGCNWEKHICKKYIEDEVHFRTTDFSWNDYKRAIRDVDFNEYFRERIAFKKENEGFLECQKKVQRYYEFMDRTYDRICFWEKYEPIKNELKAYQEKGEIEKLEKVLKPYIDKIKHYSEMNLGLCFDYDIFEMAYRIMVYKGETELAQKAAALIPEQHRQPFVLKDYKDNLI